MDYKKKKDEIKKKYAYAVNAISVANGVDTGVALDMLITNIMKNGTYAYVNVTEFKKDYAELLELCK